ncbi:hypothetical protein C8R44DRAFT_881251 [Mycena epipterygia]|nr:hypothetical protein C8R44DRAFT_881251 [Mycena epipterygia]
MDSGLYWICMCHVLFGLELSSFRPVAGLEISILVSSLASSALSSPLRPSLHTSTAPDCPAHSPVLVQPSALREHLP